MYFLYYLCEQWRLLHLCSNKRTYIYIYICDQGFDVTRVFCDEGSYVTRIIGNKGSDVTRVFSG